MTLSTGKISKPHLEKAVFHVVAEIATHWDWRTTLRALAPRSCASLEGMFAVDSRIPMSHLAVSGTRLFNAMQNSCNNYKASKYLVGTLGANEQQAWICVGNVLPS